MAALANELRTRRRRAVASHSRGAEKHVLTECCVRVGVVDPRLEETLVLAVQRDLDALAPRAAHVLEEEADGPRGGDREDLVLHVAPIECQAAFEPRPWLRVHTDLVVAHRDGLERWVGRG